MNSIFLYAFPVEHLTAPSTTEVYEQHQKIFEKTVPTYRRVAGILKEMEVMNLIGTRNVSKGRGGRNNEVWLKIPAHGILERTIAEWEPKWLDHFGKKLEEFKKRFPGIAASRVR